MDDVNHSAFAGPVVRLSSSGRLTPRGLLSFAWGLWRRRAEWQGAPVILLSVGAQMAFFLLAAAGLRLPERTVCFFHGSEVLRFRRNRCWRGLARRFYRRPGVRFAVTTRYVEKILRESGLLPEKAEVAIALCALPGVFHVEHSPSKIQDPEIQDPSKIQDSRSKAEGENAELCVLTVARLHPRKGQVEVARALGVLPVEQRQRVVYQMVGVGEEKYRKQVERVCREGGVRCEFLGAMDDAALGCVYGAATLYVQASRTLAQSVEGFGITFLEAAAYGCPAAAWRSGGVAEAVLDGETGLLVDEGDVEGLVAAVSRLLADAGLRKRLGEKGKTFARTFSWERSARVLHEVATKAEDRKRSL